MSESARGKGERLSNVPKRQLNREGLGLINLWDEEVGQATSVLLSMPQAEPLFQHLLY